MIRTEADYLHDADRLESFRGLARSIGLLRVKIAPASSAAIALVISTAARAQTTSLGGTEAQTMLNNIASFILGPFGQTLAVLGIIGIGLAWMFGRVSLGLIAGVIGGIIIMFGASYLATTLTTAGGATTG